MVLSLDSHDVSQQLPVSRLPQFYSGTECSKDDMIASRQYIKKFLDKNIIIEFSRDPSLLRQYYRIRDQEFRSVWGVKSFCDSESEYDRLGHIMIVRIGNLCIGGLRLNIKSPRKPKPLPMEIKDFWLENHFPELSRKQMTYAQTSAFALLPEFCDKKVSCEMIRRVIKKAAALNSSMLFGTSPLVNSILYRQTCVLMGLKNTQIREDIVLPPYPYLEEIKLYLISIPVMDLENNHAIDHEDFTDENALLR